MCIRIAPPGRTSSSQTGLVKYVGPHQRASISGSVHALNTISRGASRIRSSTTVGCSVTGWGEIAEVSVLLFVVVTFILLLLYFPEVILQAVKSLVPEPSVLLNPT